MIAARTFQNVFLYCYGTTQINSTISFTLSEECCHGYNYFLARDSVPSATGDRQIVFKIWENLIEEPVILWGNKVLKSAPSSWAKPYYTDFIRQIFLKTLPSPPPIVPSHLSSGYCQIILYFNVSDYILLACLSCWLGSTYRWDHMVFVFHHLAFFT